MSFLTIEGLSKTFFKENTAVEIIKRIDLKVDEGEFVTIVGPSGCGKTTFLRILSGALEPSGGVLKAAGKVLEKSGTDRGFVFQQDNLFPWFNVLDNITLGLKIRGVSKPKRYEVGQRLVDLVRLRGFEKHYPYELSGGMRQRVNLARALAIDPKILLMDEPLAALDAQTRELMQRELIDICNQAGKTVLFVTHQIDEAIYMGDRVVVLSATPSVVKEIVEIQSPRDRPLDIKRTKIFIEYVERIWKLIETKSSES